MDKWNYIIHTQRINKRLFIRFIKIFCIFGLLVNWF